MAVASRGMGIGVSVFLRDHFSSKAAVVAGSMKKLNRTAYAMNDNLLRAVRTHNMVMLGGAAAASAGIVKAHKNYADFDYTLQYVKTITQATGEQFDGLTKKSLQLGRTTIFTSDQVADAAKFMAMAGMDIEQINGNLQSAVHLAAATQSELGGKGGTADIMTNIMAAFKKDASESAKVADILSIVTTSTNTNLHDLGQSVAYAGDTLKDLNIPLEEGVTMLGLLGNAGIQGSRAGTSLANMWRYLSRAIGDFSTGNQSKAMAELGLTPDDFKDAKGGLKDTGDLLKLIFKAASGKTNLEGQNLLEALFGVRGKRAASTLIEQTGKYSDILQKIADNQGFAAKSSEDMMNTSKGALLVLQNSWDTLSKNWGRQVDGFIVPLYKGITSILDGINAFVNTDIGGFLAKGLTGFLLVKGAAAAYKIVLSTIALTHKTSQALFQSRVASTVAGYGAMSKAAKGYATSAAMASGMGSPFYTQTINRMGKGGKPISYSVFRKTKGGRFTSKEAVERYQRRMAATRTGQAGGFRGTHWASKLLGGSSVLGRLTPILGRLAGALAGPWGIALSFLLPNAISYLTKSTDENTEAIKEQTKKSNELLERTKGGYVHKTETGMAEVTQSGVIKDIHATKILQSLEGQQNHQNHARPIVIQVDGLEAKIKRIIDDTYRADLSYQ